ncbi:hypothetical protein CCP3SC1_270049 [Gammaproteobacteria bacterium]
MWPRNSSINYFNLLEISHVSKFFKYAKLEQIRAIISTLLAIGKHKEQFVIT